MPVLPTPGAVFAAAAVGVPSQDPFWRLAMVVGCSAFQAEPLAAPAFGAEAPAVATFAPLIQSLTCPAQAVPASRFDLAQAECQ